MNADGTDQRRLTTDAAFDADPTFSPDGTRLAFTSTRDGNTQIYVMAVDGSAQRRLTFDPAVDQLADWSPDGSRIAFESTRDINTEIYTHEPRWR
jgi:Tol biopolymer transport system component